VPQVAQLKAAMDKEQAAYEEEWSALTKMIEEDRKAQVGLEQGCCLYWADTRQLSHCFIVAGAGAAARDGHR
jgi:hypothetical protein